MENKTHYHRKLFYILSGFTFLFFVALCFITGFLYLKSEIRHVRKFCQYSKKFVKNIKKGSSLPSLGGLTIPKYLSNVPCSEKEGVFISSKIVEIEGVDAPYNASIIKGDDAYLLFFRYDIISGKSPIGYHTYIGCVELDEDFNQKKPFKKLETATNSSEDPRVVKIGPDIFLIYNDFMPGFKNCRTMHIAKLNQELDVLYKTSLDLHMQPIEKNWSPFEYIENKVPKVCFEYVINPHKILKLENPQTNNIIQPTFNKPTYRKIYWPKEWGILRGGTTSEKVDGEYLSFFHSSFKDEDGFCWYIMGAYTFEEKPPFNLTKISNYPILFKDLYSTPIINTASINKRVIFPCGFIVEKKDGKDLLHISCGENDCAVRIITLDKKALFKSLKKL